MILEGLWEVFKGDSADTCAGKFPLVSVRRRGARTPIGESGINILQPTTKTMNTSTDHYTWQFNSS